MINLSGQVVLRENFTSTYREIDVSGMASGIYSIVVESGNRRVSGQLIIVNK
jgi:hypothetical protein